MKKSLSFSKGAVVLAVGILFLATLATAGTRRFRHPIEFSLVSSDPDPAPMSFTLAPRLAMAGALAAPGSAGVIEDSNFPWRTAIGWEALAINSGERNTASGFGALCVNTTGSWNTANGMLALSSNTISSHNTATGAHALSNNTTGECNTANGSRALSANITGTRNTASGVQALNCNTTGSHNTATGCESLYSNTTGGGNVANGFSALQANTEGGNNTATGCESLENNVDGRDNTATGRWSLGLNISGHFNTALGSWAGEACIQGNYNLFLGANVRGLPEDTNTIRIGSPYAYDSSANMQTGQNQTFIAGITETPFIAGDAPAVVGITNEGRLGTMSSDLLPPGPQGPAGEGLVSGSLLFLVPSATPPAGYAFLGTCDFSLGGKKPTKLTVNVYKKQ